LTPDSPGDRLISGESVSPCKYPGIKETVMKYLLLATVLLTLVLPCRGQDLKTEAGFTQFLSEKTEEAIGLLQEGEYDKAITVYAMLADLPGISAYRSAHSGIHYNLACAYSLSGRKEEALTSLGKAVELGFANMKFMEEDSDLESLRDDPRYKEIMAGIRAQEDFWASPALETEYRRDISVEEKTAGLAKLWSEVKFNFAFFHQVPDLDWDSLFVAYLPKVRETRSTREYYRTLAEMCAHLKDGHTRVTPPQELWDSLWAKPAIRTRLVEDRVLVVDVLAEALEEEGIVPGVEVLRIDGLPVRRYAEEKVMPYQCASTPQGLREVAYGYSLLSGPVDRKVKLALEDAGGEIFTRSLERTRRQASRPVVEFRMLGGNLGYVALNSFGTEEVVSGFDSVFTLAEDAAALIIDLRENYGGNSSFGYQILGRLTGEPFTTTSWRSRQYIPTLRAWGMAPSWYRPPVSTFQPGGGEPYLGPLVLLTGPQTASAAEDFCVAFRSMGRGVIMGEPTYGSTGQPLIVGLPGGGSAQVCTKHDTYPDGTEYVGVGIQPDIVVSPTVEDVRSGRDPVLDRAVAHLRGAEDRSGRDPAPDQTVVKHPAAEDPSGGALTGDEFTLLRVCEAIVRLFESEADSIWPGYSLAEQPFVVYVTDRWALLFNPEGPVEGFGPCPPDWPDLGVEVLYHEGRYGDLAGQLVFDLRLGETTTLAVGFPSEFPEHIENPAAEALAYIVHEAFHQYQHATFSDVPWVREEKYPLHDTENASEAYLEMLLLEDAIEAIQAGDREAARERMKEFLTIRLVRWTVADHTVSIYEQGKELLEGTAKYVELRCLEAMLDVHYTSSMDGIVDPLAAFFPEVTMPGLLLKELRERMGDGCLEYQDIPRNRIYAVAAAQAYLLDYLGLDWKGLAEAGDPGGPDFRYRSAGMPGYLGFEYRNLLVMDIGFSGAETHVIEARAKRAHDYESIFTCAREARDNYGLGYREALEAFESQPGQRIELVVPTSNLSRSRVSRAKKWLVDSGRFLLCNHFDVYTLRGGEWSLELHDAGLLEINDWDAGVKKVVFYDPGVDSVSLDDERTHAVTRGTREFTAVELSGDRFEIRGTQPGRFIASDDTVRVQLITD
jgi:C-terminal processing protease CtpA/Prc